MKYFIQISVFAIFMPLQNFEYSPVCAKVTREEPVHKLLLAK